MVLFSKCHLHDLDPAAVFRFGFFAVFTNENRFLAPEVHHLRQGVWVFFII